MHSLHINRAKNLICATRWTPASHQTGLLEQNEIETEIVYESASDWQPKEENESGRLIKLISVEKRYTLRSKMASGDKVPTVIIHSSDRHSPFTPP